ncbi:hypothetical protein ACSBR1_009064 [Camellia fascicularis]
MVENSVGEPELLCNNRGVDFIEAFAYVKLQDLNLYNPNETIEGKLVPKKMRGVLCVQATELVCGGLVVACTFDHRVADAYSASLFLVSWAEMAQSKPFSMLPSFRRFCFNSKNQLFYPKEVSFLPKKPSKKSKSQFFTNFPKHSYMINCIYYIQADQLSHPQSLVDGSGIGRKKTKLEAFSAFLWKMVVAREVERNKICWMGIVVNGMLRMGSKETDKLKLMNSYFGNVLSISLGEKRADELRERPLSWAADMVHECLESAVTKEHFLDLIDWVEVHRLEPALTKLYANGGDEDTGPAFVVSPEQQFPVSKVDFGWGKPMLGSHHFPLGMETGYVMPMPSPLGNGDWVVYMHLLKGQMELIETHSARVVRPLTFS